jgi:VanZ family protein
VPASAVSKWQRLLPFGIGFVLAFGGTIALGSLGPSPLLTWALVLAVTLILWRFPALREPRAFVPVIATYALPLTTLWMLSNPRTPGSSYKIFIFQALVALFVVGSVGAALWLFSAYQKIREVRATIRALLPFFLCAWLVAFFSSSAGAAGHMVHWLMAHFGMGADQAANAVLYARKSIHFLFYGLFGLAALNAANTGTDTRRALWLALGLAVVHATFDELRQSSFTDRSASFWDVCLDSAGAATFIGISSRVLAAKGQRSRGKRD